MEVGNWRFYRIPLSREDFNDEKAIETVIDIAQRWERMPSWDSYPK